MLIFIGAFDPLWLVYLHLSHCYYLIWLCLGIECVDMMWLFVERGVIKGFYKEKYINRVEEQTICRVWEFCGENCTGVWGIFSWHGYIVDMMPTKECYYANDEMWRMQGKLNIEIWHLGQHFMQAVLVIARVLKDMVDMASHSFF